MGFWRVIKPCVEQATGRNLEPGDIVELGAFDFSMLQATGCVVPHVADARETQDVVNFEKRRTLRRRGRTP
jgi:hypothetical protein